MNNYKTVKIEEKKDYAILWLNRPQVHNAFNEIMINEILDFCSSENVQKYRAVFLRGEGKSFCAGADLNWMKSVINYSYEQNLQESINLSECFYSIYTCPTPIIAIVHGNAIGGANGLLSSCDMAYALPETTFSLSEVKIGLTPACISPYVLKKIGETKTREMMITGRRFKSEEAEKIGLINGLIGENPEVFIEELMNQIRSAGPNAVKITKELINDVVNNISLIDAKKYTAEVIAKLRGSTEGQEGMNSFLEKRKPNWNE